MISTIALLLANHNMLGVPIKVSEAAKLLIAWFLIAAIPSLSLAGDMKLMFPKLKKIVFEGFRQPG
jgi:hypothetical protein